MYRAPREGFGRGGIIAARRAYRYAAWSGRKCPFRVNRYIFPRFGGVRFTPVSDRIATLGNRREGQTYRWVRDILPLW